MPPAQPEQATHALIATEAKKRRLLPSCSRAEEGPGLSDEMHLSRRMTFLLCRC